MGRKVAVHRPRKAQQYQLHGTLHADAATGALTPRQWMPTQGATPRFITLTPDARHLIVANEGSDTLVRYGIGADGLLCGGDVVAGYDAAIAGRVSALHESYPALRAPC